MGPFTNVMSICSWIKKLRPQHDTVWFGYCWKGGDILISDSGKYNRVNSASVTWLDQFGSVPIGKWYHLCSTWSRSLNTIRIYKDGKLLKTDSQDSAGDPIPLNGQLLIGNACNGVNGNLGGWAAGYPFGGEMTKLNVFSKELIAAEIKAMSDAGIGSNIEETYGEKRHIRWEDILLKPKSGNVAETEIDIGDASVLGNKSRSHAKPRELNSVTLNLTLIPTLNSLMKNKYIC